ncbi:MAG: LTA synthase family protein [Lachnospiraceae bacterium]|nr:LTA synthase family protein [Lachnospiraceae bacterium]
MIFKKIFSMLCNFLLFLFMFLGILLAFTARWFIKTWGLLTIDEIVYHMKSSISGTNTDMIKEYVWGYGIYAFLLTLLLYGILLFFSHKKPAHRILSRIVMIAIGLCSMIYAYLAIDSAIGVTYYVKQELFGADANQSDFIADNYVDTASTPIDFPQVKRNLIYIYMESMESTYSDTANGGAFEKSRIPGLTELAKHNENFSGKDARLNGGISLPGSNWTMAGIFAQTSGLPLKVPLSMNRIEKQDDFFPTISTLGDILQKQGYNQTFMLGSNADFGGLKLYFSGHGDYRIKDYNYAIDNGILPEDYFEFWGYEDEKLYEYAKEELTALSAEDAPFNFTMITADTHFEDGYVCRLCDNTFGDDQYSNVITCADRQVISFVEWIQAQDFYKNTTIIICGDHPTMDSDFCKDVPSDYQRTTFMCILNPAASRADDSERRVFSTMDMFPTTLAAMGCTIDGDQLGLGVNLFSNKETLTERYSLPVIKTALSRTSPFINQLSSLSIKEQDLEEAKEKVKMVFSDEDGHIRFTIRKLSSRFSLESVDQLSFRCTYQDPSTGNPVEQTYECDVMQEFENDPEYFIGTAVTDIPYDQFRNVTVSVSISVAEFKDYHLCDFKYNPQESEFIVEGIE